MPPATRAKRADMPAWTIADRTLSNLTQVFKLLADESRLRILLTLAREGETHVSALCRMLNQSQPAVSHHLTLLRMAGLVGFRRAGKFNYYRMDGVTLGELLDRLFPDGGRTATITLGEFTVSFSRPPGRRR
jgi:DNA-binding transcriptional ArsR family regulator